MFGQGLVPVAANYFVGNVFDDMIWVVVHLNQYRSEHNIGSVHFGLCWQAWVVVCEFWCFGNSLSKGVHSRMALWHYGLIHEKFQ